MLKLPQKFLAMVRDLQSPTVLLVVSMALVLEWQVTLGMVLAMLVELYMAIPHSDMERGLLMLMPIIVHMAMEDIPMDLLMAMATDMGISMEKGLLMLMPTTATMATEDIPMDPPMAMATGVDISMVKITQPMREL